MRSLRLELTSDFRPVATIWAAMSSGAGIRWRGMWHGPTKSYEKGLRRNEIFRRPPLGATAKRRKPGLGMPWGRNRAAVTTGGGAGYPRANLAGRNSVG